jgi:hypothetical protein
MCVRQVAVSTGHYGGCNGDNIVSHCKKRIASFRALLYTTAVLSALAAANNTKLKPMQSKQTVLNSYV